MHPDPILAALEAAYDAARAALDAYRGTTEPQTDLITLKDVEVEFGVTNITARRWVKEKHLGVKIKGRLYCDRSLLKAHKRK